MGYFTLPNPTNSPCHTRIIELGSKNISTKVTTSVVGPQNNKEKLPDMTAKDLITFPPGIPGTFSSLQHKKRGNYIPGFQARNISGSNSVQYNLPLTPWDGHTPWAGISLQTMNNELPTMGMLGRLRKMNFPPWECLADSEK